MIEKLLPASLKNSDNPLYETILTEAEDMFEEFLDSKVRTIKNIYSISKSSAQDLIAIARDIFLIDENVLNATYEFLQSQVSNTVADYEDVIKKIICVFYGIQMVEFEREVQDGDYRYTQYGVYINSPNSTDFESYQNLSTFRSLVETYTPGVTVSIENTVLYFVYPAGVTDEMKADYPQAIMNSICDYAMKYEDGFTTMLSGDPIADGYIKSIIKKQNDFDITLVNPDDSDSLGQAIKFHIEYSEYTVDKDSAIVTISCASTEDIILARFRDEIAKIPVSIANRGTYNFYKSIFSTLGYTYPGIFSLMKTGDDSRVARLVDNIELGKHGIEGSNTAFVPVPVNENYNALEIITNRLDENYGTEEDPEYKTLDSDDIFAKLDMISTAEETLYKKDFLLGFCLDRNLFNGSSIYPYEFARFTQELIALNQKATDVVHLTPVISLDIDKDDMPESEYDPVPVVKNVPSSASFIQMSNYANRYSTLYLYNNLRIKIEAFEYNSFSNAYIKFYDYYLYNATDLRYIPNFADQDTCVTMRALIEGKKYRASRLLCEIESTKKLIVTIPNTNYITKNIIIKLFTNESEESNYFLFKENIFSQFEQCSGPLNSEGDLLYDISVSIDGNKIIFESETDFLSSSVDYYINFISEKIETNINQVKLLAEYTIGDVIKTAELTTFTFMDVDGNHLSVNLPSNVNLMFLISRHEKELA